MSRICQITGKKALVGNHVSHSNKRVKRMFYPNMMRKKFYLPEEDRWISLKVSTSGIRIINRIGLKNALEQAKQKGFIKNY